MLKNKNLILNVYLFAIGIFGIFSLLFVPFNVDTLPPEAREIIISKFSEFQLRVLSLINPIILLLISLLIGFFVNRGKPEISYFSSYINKISKKSIFYYLIIGFIYGIISALIIFILYLLVKSNDTIVFLEDKIPEMPIITKLLYGGLTEEIIVRWGWLSLFLYIINKILKKQKPSEFIAILLSSVLFGISHLPVVFQNMGDSINFYLIVYIIVFNTILGIIFGRLFLKYNIETAMFCHIFFHIFSLIFNIFFYEKL